MYLGVVFLADRGLRVDDVDNGRVKRPRLADIIDKCSHAPADNGRLDYRRRSIN